MGDGASKIGDVGQIANGIVGVLDNDIRVRSLTRGMHTVLVVFDDQSGKACFSIMFGRVPKNAHCLGGLVCFVKLTETRHYAIIVS